LAKRNTEHGSGLGVYRWVVERSISWLRQMRRSAPATNDVTTSTKPS
jgi:hypothetical protein